MCARRRQALHFHPFNFRTKAAQFLIQVFVAAVDVFDVGDFGGAFCAEGGQDHAGAGADVDAGDWDSFERCWAGNGGLVWV